MTDTNLIEDLRLLAPPNYGWLLAVGVALVVLAALVLLRRALRRRASGKTIPSGVPLDPADDTLAELERLTRLLRSECSREYGIRSTAVLRGYVETRYGLNAPKLATEEFLLAARHSSLLPAEHQTSLGAYLERCDLFKFGRYLATADELQQLHAAAVTFVLCSRPKAPSPNSTEGAA
jgi:hypothetical protein